MAEFTETKNAKITSTMLGIEDHGILSCMIYLDYGGSGQGFGGYAMDQWSERHGRRIGAAYGAEFILRVLHAVGVERWEDLPGKHVRVRSTYSKVHAIGHIIEDRWFSPDDLAKEADRG